MVSNARKLLLEAWDFASRELEVAGNRVLRRLRLHVYALKTASDPGLAKAAAQARGLARNGLPPEKLLGWDELAELKRATQSRP